MLDNQASKFVAFWYMPTLPKGWEENRRLCVSDVCLHCFFFEKKRLIANALVMLPVWCCDIKVSCVYMLYYDWVIETLFRFSVTREVT